MAQRPGNVPSFEKNLQRDKIPFDDDCTPCRIVGAATFVALGGFTFVSGHLQIDANAAAIRASRSIFGIRSRRVAITGASAIMTALGVYRWFH